MAPSIILDFEVRRNFVSRLRRSGSREIGGILFGEQLSPARFRLVDFTVDDLIGGAAHFSRSVNSHGIELERFFERTGHDFRKYNYLGEWHSHPRFPVTPSAQDCRSMRDLVQSEANINFAALLIVRLDWMFFLRARAIMFSRKQAPEPIELIRR